MRFLKELVRKNKKLPTKKNPEAYNVEDIKIIVEGISELIPTTA